MKIQINLGYGPLSLEMRDIQFWNQRIFFKGVLDNDEVFTFISTNQFTDLMMRHPDGNIRYKFVGTKFSPISRAYKHKKDKLEIDLIETGDPSFEDVGPSEYSAKRTKSSPYGWMRKKVGIKWRDVRHCWIYRFA